MRTTKQTTTMDDETSVPFSLTSEIIALSVSDTWQDAREEWELDHVYFIDTHDGEEPGTCLCGHYPIVEVCVLSNKYNGNLAEVGNVCVKRFLGLPSDKIFRALDRIRLDITKSIGRDTMLYAFKQGWIGEWERNFYTSTLRKRKMTGRQIDKRVEINCRILRGISKREVLVRSEE